MKPQHWTVLLFVCAALLFHVGAAEASDPVGIYAIVEKVTFEPNAQAPERILIFGAFALSDGQHGYGYLPPKRGYLYYSLPSAVVPWQRDAALKEWADLKKVAGTGDVIAFGGRHTVTGRLRNSGTRAQAPDWYPIQMGIIQIGKQRNAVNQHIQPIIVPGLREALNAR
jgi:hypothetical protein